MLLILSAALLPLGLIAVFASLESAQGSRLRRSEDSRAMAAQAARQLTSAIGRSSLDLRAVTARLDMAPMARAEQVTACRDMLAVLHRAQRDRLEYAVLTTDGRRVCATPDFGRRAPAVPSELFATEVQLLTGPTRLQFEARSPGGALYGVVEMPAATIAALVALPSRVGIRHGIALRQDRITASILPYRRDLPIGRQLRILSPVAGGQVTLELLVNALPITATEVLLALLPILMWMAAGLIGWLVVERLLIRPLLRLQTVVSDYRPEHGPIAIPHLTTPAREIRSLGEAFRDVTERVSVHEAEVKAGLERQMKLTREVHHRVKNNLQVVSSLINIHSRGVADSAVAAAYATIQRRVDALAVVHRNHFAELEANQGVGLRPLIGELAANLRATAAPEATSFGITLDLMTAHASQDVAVPVAFIITEVIEVAMMATPRGRATIALVPTDKRDRATLSITAVGLAGSPDRAGAPSERFRRVMEGLSRQMRAKLEIDEATGRHAIEITIIPQNEG